MVFGQLGQTYFYMNVGDSGGLLIRRTFIHFLSELEPNATRKSHRVFHSQHQCEEWEMIKECQTGIEAGFHRNDQHAGRCKGQVEDNHGREEEEEHCEENCAKK